MKVLYVEKDINVRDIYVMKLEADFRAEVVEVKNAKEAIEVLKAQKDFVFILSDEEIASNAGQGLYAYVFESHIKIPYIMLGNDSLEKHREFATFKTDHTGNRHIPTPVDEERFKSVLGQVIQLSKWKKELHEHTNTEHTPVRLRNFTRFSTLPVDVFIRLSEEKFVMLLQKDDMYSGDVLKKYKEKGVKFLYVKSEDYSALADLSVKTLLHLYDRKSMSTEQKQAIQLMAIEDIHKQIDEYGIPEEVMDLTKKTIETSVSMVRKNPSLWKLLKDMKTQGDYIFDHSLKLSYIAAAVAKNTEWNSDSTCLKLSLAATVHDMTLKNHQLARIQDLKDLDPKQFTEQEIEDFKNHPINASELVKADKGLPRDVHFIVAQHHERPDGTGFPRGLSKLRIAPLACIFICAHEFYTRMDKLGKEFSDENRDLVLKEMAPMFNVGNFKKPFAGLKKAFAEIKKVQKQKIS